MSLTFDGKSSTNILAPEKITLTLSDKHTSTVVNCLNKLHVLIVNEMKKQEFVNLNDEDSKNLLAFLGQIEDAYDNIMTQLNLFRNQRDDLH